MLGSPAGLPAGRLLYRERHGLGGRHGSPCLAATAFHSWLSPAAPKGSLREGGVYSSHGRKAVEWKRPGNPSFFLFEPRQGRLNLVRACPRPEGPVYLRWVIGWGTWESGLLYPWAGMVSPEFVCCAYEHLRRIGRGIMPGPSLAILFHVTHWQCSVPEVPLADGVVLSSTANTDVLKRYDEECYNKGLDDGEPLSYPSCARLAPRGPDDYLLDLGDPYARAERLCNTIVVVTGQPLSYTRAFASYDRFRTVCQTWLLHQEGTQTSFLRTKFVSFSDETVVVLKKVWLGSERLWSKDKALGRINNALAFFHHAWTSRYIDHGCLNLAICMEGLFAPHIQSETTHQVCFNISRFLGGHTRRTRTVVLRTARVLLVAICCSSRRTCR
jgi:hypothetical protein